MHQIDLTVRFCVCRNADAEICESNSAVVHPHNSFAGWPPMAGLGAFYEIGVSCSGEPDSATGYLLNISEIDRAVRSVVIPMIQRHFSSASPPGIGTAILNIIDSLRHELNGDVTAVVWRLSP